MGAFLELADAFLADTQVQADLLERLLGDAADPIAVHDDPALAPVQSAEERSTTARLSSWASTVSY